MADLLVILFVIAVVCLVLALVREGYIRYRVARDG